MSTPEAVKLHLWHGSVQVGALSVPMQKGVQTPLLVSGSTPQHIERASQSSMPELTISTMTACAASGRSVRDAYEGESSAVAGSRRRRAKRNALDVYV
jgi:hypothetical protein